MLHHDAQQGFQSPTPTRHCSNSRYFYTRRIESVPGFDLGTPRSSHITSSCQLLRAIKSSQCSILSPVNESPNDQAYVDHSCLISNGGERILDAPDVVDDYYLNLISWSDSNLIAVALRSRLYVWNVNTQQAQVLTDLESNIITSVAWMKGGSCLAIGDSAKNVKLVDVEKMVEVRNICAHSDRVSSLAWNGCVLTSGSRDSSIISHDLRVKDYFFKYLHHKQEVCGLRWNLNSNLLASGSNDNSVCIWDQSMLKPLFHLSEHTSAVKAVAWCPYKFNLLATGGGALDKTIKLWDCNQGTCLFSKDTGSQVSALEFNSLTQDLISAHGYSKNQIAMWKGNELKLNGEMNGHQGRILNMLLSPDQSMLVSLSADETLRFWRLLPCITTGCESPSGFQVGWR